jgi:hypothetical protein
MLIDQPADPGSDRRGEQQRRGKDPEEQAGREAEAGGDRGAEDRWQVIAGGPGERLRRAE